MNTYYMVISSKVTSAGFQRLQKIQMTQTDRQTKRALDLYDLPQVKMRTYLTLKAVYLPN